MKNLQYAIAAAFGIVPILAARDVPNAERLNLLTDQIASVGEFADDSVELLPFGIANVAKLAIDNVVVDSWQRTYLWKPIAEVVFQAWKTVHDAVESLSDFAQGIVKPGLALVAELASTENLSNDERRERLEAKVLDALKGVTNVVNFLPPGVREFAQSLLGLESVQNFEQTIAAFIAAVLYQVWKALHPTVPTLALA